MEFVPASPDSDRAATDDSIERTGSMAAINYLQSLVERDKTSLAREIHDDLGGYLVATAMDVAVLKKRFAAHEDSAHIFDRAANSINAAVDMMRRITEELRPTLLDNVGLLAAPMRSWTESCTTAIG